MSEVPCVRYSLLWLQRVKRTCQIKRKRGKAFASVVQQKILVTVFFARIFLHLVHVLCTTGVAEQQTIVREKPRGLLMCSCTYGRESIATNSLIRPNTHSCAHKKQPRRDVA